MHEKRSHVFLPMFVLYVPYYSHGSSQVAVQCIHAVDSFSFEFKLGKVEVLQQKGILCNFRLFCGSCV